MRLNLLIKMSLEQELHKASLNYNNDNISKAKKLYQRIFNAFQKI